MNITNKCKLNNVIFICKVIYKGKKRDMEIAISKTWYKLKNPSTNCCFNILILSNMHSQLAT